MPEKIQRVAGGFLDLLGIKSLGRQPPFLTDEVRPTVDMSEWYLSTTLETVQNTASGESALDAEALVTVPNGQLWRVHAIAGFCQSLTAAANLQFAVGVRMVDGTLVRLAGSHTAHLAAQPLTRYTHTAILSPPILLPSGSGVSCILDKALGIGTTQIVIRALVNVLQQ